MTVGSQCATMRAIEALLRASDDLPVARRDELLRRLSADAPPHPQPSAPERVLSVREAADALHVTTRTVQRLCTQGHLKRVRLPGRTRGVGILASSLTDLLSAGASGVTP
jgi:excisionase family DNA binding protein